MDNITQSAENIKRLVLTDITQNETTRIRSIFGIGLNDLTLINYFFNLRERNAACITASLRVSANPKFTSIKFLANLFNHMINYNIRQKQISQEKPGINLSSPASNGVEGK